jgi:hypothetical protein
MKTKLAPPPAVLEWYSQIGKLGGQSKSPAKLAAIAKNAKKGGWPKGRPRKVGFTPALLIGGGAGVLATRTPPIKKAGKA